MITKKVYCLINEVTFWDKLPWPKINLRISMITKHIYKAMKKYDLIYVYKLQKYLINCNEGKVVLIKKNLYNLQLYYNNCTNIKLLIKNINKIDLLHSLFITRSQIDSSFFEQIKQNLIYISIKPTWKAKIAKHSTQLIDIIPLNYLLNTHENIKSNFFLGKIIIKKISCYNYTNKSISQWLNKNIYLNLEYMQYINNNRFSQSKFDTNVIECLYSLIGKIVENDLFWYQFNCIRSSKNFFKITNNKTIIKLKHCKKQNITISNFNLIFKQLLYRKTYENFNKINIFNNQTKLLNNIKSLYKNHYYSSLIFISLDLTKSCNKIINYFIYTLGKKQIINYYYAYKLKIINQLLNKFIYFCNIQYLYKNY
uniref:hypothetical protein n=1 Tax=Lophurella caespitosa TaxID=2666335 RepID=UPI002551D2E4|nr:hypothetical protein QQP83_pgt015 [Lophurella caespitosa]WGH13129.1 hypothetical protein [Lophurella caespitosa]